MTLKEFGFSSVHWSLGLTVFIGLSASEFSGAVTIVALPITALCITLSALASASLGVDDGAYKKRKLGDFLEFVGIWVEMLELLVAGATCARIVSATIDYISREKMREWFLGLQSHSLGEPWPDVVGVSVIIVITALFMLGLERSPIFIGCLLFTLLFTFVFFLAMGTLHTTLTLAKWAENFKTCTVQSIFSAAALCSYSFTNTLPKTSKFRALKIFAIVCTPLVLYSSTIIVFTLMSHYKELSLSATPLLKIFELRDVDWARLVMSVCTICLVGLTLTEIFPCLYKHFERLASKEWQIFLGLLQYRNSFTGAPLLTIFAAGSLAAILAFACPLTYLVQTLNATTLLKGIVRAFHLLYYLYRAEFRNENYMIGPSSTQYSKLKSSKKEAPSLKGKVTKLLCCKRGVHASVNKNRANAAPSQDDEYLLLNDYNDKSAELVPNDESSDDNDEKESVLSSDVESNSSTDVDAVVQEYKDKIQVVTIDNFNDNKYPTYVTATTVIIFLLIIAIAAVALSQFIVWRFYNLIWPCFTVLFFATLIIMVMPVNSTMPSNGVLPPSITPMFTLISLQCHTILVTFVLSEIWPGVLFWFFVGCLLFWRCDCCTCDGLLVPNQKNKLNITENLSEYEKYVDTIVISR